MIHTTLLRKMNGTMLEEEHHACEEGEEIMFDNNDSESIVVSSVTYGAPSAHALGFKNGGLNEVIQKLHKLNASRGRDSQVPVQPQITGGNGQHSPYDAMGSGIGVGSMSTSVNTNNSFSSSLTSSVSSSMTQPNSFSTGVQSNDLTNHDTKNRSGSKQDKKSPAEELYHLKSSKRVSRNPDTALKTLTYEFEATVREGVVISQALTGTVCAAIDLIRRLIRDGLKEEEELFNKNNMEGMDEMETAASLHGANASQKVGQWSGGPMDAVRLYGRSGLVVHSACLLSTAGDEDNMIDDFAAAYDRLNIDLSIVESTNHNYNPYEGNGYDNPNEIVVRVVEVQKKDNVASLGAVVVKISISPKSAYDWFSELVKDGNKLDPEFNSRQSTTLSSTSAIPTVQTIKLIPILFNIGVNEMQSVANATFSQAIKKQTEINEKGLYKLLDYYRAVSPTLQASLYWSSLTHELVNKLDKLVEVDAASHGKLVELLSVSSKLARLLNGARTTSCKSAKDRTSVYHSLEVTQTASAHGLIDQSKEQELLDELRGINGVRLRNCEANTGKAKYAFNKLQMQALPVELRPPAYTASSGKS